MLIESGLELNGNGWVGGNIVGFDWIAWAKFEAADLSLKVVAESD